MPSRLAARAQDYVAHKAGSSTAAYDWTVETPKAIITQSAQQICNVANLMDLIMLLWHCQKQLCEFDGLDKPVSSITARICLT